MCKDHEPRLINWSCVPCGCGGVTTHKYRSAEFPNVELQHKLRGNYWIFKNGRHVDSGKRNLTLDDMFWRLGQLKSNKR